MFRALVVPSLLVCVACNQTSKDAPSPFGARVTSPSVEPAPLPVLAASAPPDRPVQVAGEAELEALAKAIAPYREEARRTYPTAKKRFLAGLPPGHHFFVTATLREGAKQENVFVSVSEIKDGVVVGRLASDVALLSEHKSGDPVQLPELDVEDWTITRPDGGEDGNVVGKFLDTWPQRSAPRAD